MSESRRSTRRTSARLADKEDIPITNGIGHTTDNRKGGQTNGASVKQGKTNVNGPGTAVGGARSKRKYDYDEEDDGFMFTRTRSKKTKAAPQVEPSEPVRSEIREDQQRPEPVKKSRKKSSGTKPIAPVEKEPQIGKRRRSARNSGEHVEQNVPEPPALEIKKKRAKDTEPVDLKHSKASHVPEAARPNDQVDETAGLVGQTAQLQTVEKAKDTTKIALPFADTPIIRRNKEMRKGAENGHRRSSLGMRGRRASSLIDSGKSNALPHDEVESSEFYKHIESNSLPEPRRMRQLLTWCGTRALGEKSLCSSEDSSSQLAAREIEQQLLKDFSTKSELSDWFTRRDSPPPPQPPQPNPKNVSNLAKIQDLEQQIARLQSERQTWESLLRPPPSNTSLLEPLSQTSLPHPSLISPSILGSPTQIAALTTLQSFTPTDTDNKEQHSLFKISSTRLHQITQNLEFEVDKFACNVHALDAYNSAAERVADEVLSLSAEALEERDRKGVSREGEEVGIRGVLRSLSRVIDR